MTNISYDYLFDKLLKEKISPFPEFQTKILFQMIYSYIKNTKKCNHEKVLDRAFFNHSIVFNKYEFIFGVRILIIWTFIEIVISGEQKTIEDYELLILEIIKKHLKSYVDDSKLNRCSKLIKKELIYQLKTQEYLGLTHLTTVIFKKFIFLKKVYLFAMIKDTYKYLHRVGALDTTGLMLEN